jgi:hypothetical protein
MYLDYVLPIGLPFSFGASVKPLDPDFFGLGIRGGYHINCNVENLDLYAVYTVNVDLAGEFGILEYGLRAGARYRLLSFLCLDVETGFKMKSLSFGFSLKLN